MVDCDNTDVGCSLNRTDVDQLESQHGLAAPPSGSVASGYSGGGIESDAVVQGGRGSRQPCPRWNGNAERLSSQSSIFILHGTCLAICCRALLLSRRWAGGLGASARVARLLGPSASLTLWSLLSAVAAVCPAKELALLIAKMLHSRK